MKKGGCKRVEAGGEGKKKEGKKKEGQWGPPVHCTLASNVHLPGAVFTAASVFINYEFAFPHLADFPTGKEKRRGRGEEKVSRDCALHWRAKRTNLAPCIPHHTPPECTAGD